MSIGMSLSVSPSEIVSMNMIMSLNTEYRKYMNVSVTMTACESKLECKPVSEYS